MELEDYIQRATTVYKELAAIPSATKGSLFFTENHGGQLSATITSHWTQRDLIRKENKTFQRNHIVSCDRDPKKVGSVHELSMPVELKNIQLVSRSPAGTFQAIVKKTPATKKDEEKQFLEIWSQHNMVTSIDISASDKHGDICEDAQFGSLQWSPSEKQLLYVAEKKKEKSLSYFDQTDQDMETSKPQPKKGCKYDYQETWGEQLTNRHHPVLAVLDVTTENITVIYGIPEYLSVGQAVWGPEEKGVFFSGWWHDPYRLGLVYCTNRRSGIFYISLDGSGFEQLSKDGDAVTSPRFIPSTEKLIYLARDKDGVHLSCMRLMEFDWKTKIHSTVIDVVHTTDKANGFPGIYANSLPTKCWSTDGTKVVFGSFWKSNLKILAVDLTSKSVFCCTEDNGCWNVLDVHEDFILASFSSPSQPHKLMIAPIPTNGVSAQWTAIAGSECTKDIKWESFELSYDVNGSNTDFEAVLIQLSNQQTKPQLIVHPHGGPHSVYPSTYMIEYRALCKLGYAVLSVNYRGSLGFGLQSLESLPGHIGTQDVNEVKFAVDEVLKRGGFDADNVFVMGGSHGGFLTCHLIGQYPGFFRAAVMRNPVVNIVSMVGTTDIPDWCFEEASLSFNEDLLTDADTYAKLLACSPIVHAKKIVTPTMLMLGGVDLRVPPSQGKELYRALKARNIKVKLLLYPEDCHPLNKVETESDSFVNIAKWFFEQRTT